MSPAAPPPADNTSHFNAAEALAAIREQQYTYRRRIEVRSAPLYTAWGLAWLIGYGVCGLSVGGDYALAPGPFLVFMGCLVAAAVFTCVYIARRSRGLRGRSTWVGTLYGLAWAGGMILAFATSSRVGAFLSELGTAQATNMGAILSNALPCLVVGVLFLAGAAIWEETSLAVTGSWVLVTTLAATIVGGHALWAIMALAGGGGLVAAGITTALLGRRQSAPVRD
ncbi:hypothetical protein [Actinomyces sp. 565]|uniref:hypothetical protein n=1 Tax=Actinomyces sp. 565 TaxID=2057794 RepID=UPI0013A68CD5|nr:hypothetical protein [Actinomyces sp. 565]NDR54786.1 hypothetical protein [Actinomyces sp. 565]